MKDCRNATACFFRGRLGGKTCRLSLSETVFSLRRWRLSDADPIVRSPFRAVLMFRSRAALELENVALRHQHGVLKRSVRKRPKLTGADRLFWVFLFRVWCDWRSALDIVKPATVIAWHRKGFRLFWTRKIRHGRMGRPWSPAKSAI